MPTGDLSPQTQTSLTLDAKGNAFDAANPPAFTLVHVNLSGSDLLDTLGHLKAEKALSAITDAVTKPDDLQNVVIKAVITTQADTIARPSLRTVTR